MSDIILGIIGGGQLGSMLAIAAKKFSKGKNNVKVINVHGEWNNYLKLFHKKSA